MKIRCSPWRAAPHLIYCETKKIAVREDLVAQGPLHLEAIAITGCNGSGSSNAVQLPRH